MTRNSKWNVHAVSPLLTSQTSCSSLVSQAQLVFSSVALPAELVTPSPSLPFQIRTDSMPIWKNAQEIKKRIFSIKKQQQKQASSVIRNHVILDFKTTMKNAS